MSACTDDSEAEPVSPFAELLLDDEAVLGIVAELRPRTDYSTGRDYGRVRPSELAGGPAEGAVAGVVRQWSAEQSRSDDEPMRPGIISVTSMVLKFPSVPAATAAIAALVDDVTDDGGVPVRHELSPALVTPPDEDGAVSAVAATQSVNVVVTLQVEGIERIGSTTLNDLLDALIKARQRS